MHPCVIIAQLKLLCDKHLWLSTLHMHTLLWYEPHSQTQLEDLMYLELGLQELWHGQASNISFLNVLTVVCRVVFIWHCVNLSWSCDSLVYCMTMLEHLSAVSKYGTIVVNMCNYIYVLIVHAWSTSSKVAAFNYVLTANCSKPLPEFTKMGIF